MKSTDPNEPLHVCGVLTHGPEVVEDAYGSGLLQNLLLIVLEDGQGKSEEHLAALVQERVPDTQHGLHSRLKVRRGTGHKHRCVQLPPQASYPHRLCETS